MNVIGVTGIIGSGKSSVCEIFKIIGIPVFYADIESKRFLEDKAVIYQLQKLFGEDVCNRDGNIDRKFLAEHVFDNQEKLIQLNSILHPKVKLRFDEWKNDNADHPYGIIEAAILFESGFNRFCDAVIVVDAPDELCIQRVIEREKCSREVVKQRMPMNCSAEMFDPINVAPITQNGSDLSARKYSCEVLLCPFLVRDTNKPIKRMTNA